MNRDKLSSLIVIASILFASFVGAFPVHAETAEFGNDSGGTSTSSFSGTHHVASRFYYDGGDATIVSMRVNTVAVDAQEANVNLAVWTDDEGVPDVVVAYTDQINFDAADNGWTEDIPCDNYNSINGTLSTGYYWVGARVAVQYQPWGIRRSSSGGEKNYAIYTGTVSISAPFPTPSYSNDRSLCIVVTYSTGAEYVIGATDDDHSTISPSGSVTVADGANQTFTFSADGGYHIESVTVDGSAQSVTASYTFYDVSANHTIAITSTNWGDGAFSRDSVRRTMLLVGLFLLLAPPIYMATRPEWIGAYLYSPLVMILGIALLYYTSVL